jgi:hypothetical protein
LYEGDVYWQNDYPNTGTFDSLRKALEGILKEKYFTNNVIRKGLAYEGDIKNFHIDCRKYGRKYADTPRVYWDGYWNGRFHIRLDTHTYHVTVYALHYEWKGSEPSNPRYKGKRKGRYVDLVSRQNRSRFRPSQVHDMMLLSLALKEVFDLKSAGDPKGDAQR